MNINKKSRGLAFALSFFFGPIGVLYASGIGGLILIILTMVSATTIIIPVILWVAGLAVADSAVVKHNDSIDKFNYLMSKK